MRKDDIRKRLEKMGYKVTTIINGKILISNRRISRVFDSLNAARCLFQ